MEKLQLYINITLRGQTDAHGSASEQNSQEGYRNILDINGDVAIKRYVGDASGVLDAIDYNSQKKSIFYLLKYVTQGIFLTVLRTIPDKKPNHLAAWIFIPYQVNVSDTEFTDVVNVIVKAVNQSKISADSLAEIREVFDRQYPVIDSAGAIAPNRGTHYAHRFYSDASGHTLNDLIGKKRYQPSYLPYAGVILAERKAVKTIYGADLTDDPLEQMVKLLPPKSDNPTYTPTIYGQPFDRPYLVPLMGTVELVWEGPDNNDFRQSVVVSRPNLQPESCLPSQPSRPAPKAAPHPASKESVPTTPSAETMSEAEPKPAEAPTPITRPRPTPPPRIIDDIVDPGPFDFSSCNSTKAVWALIGLIIGALITLACTWSGGEDSPERAIVVNSASKAAAADTIANDTATVTAPQTPQATAPAAQSDIKAEATADNKADNAAAQGSATLEAAIKYLDSNDTWTKAQLESYPDLAGLFDDLNNINKQKLARVWGKKLVKSKTFKKVVDHTEYNHKNPRLPQGQTTFLKPGEKQEIYVQRYLNTIDP